MHEGRPRSNQLGNLRTRWSKLASSLKWGPFGPRGAPTPGSPPSLSKLAFGHSNWLGRGLVKEHVAARFGITGVIQAFFQFCEVSKAVADLHCGTCRRRHATCRRRHAACNTYGLCSCNIKNPGGRGQKESAGCRSRDQIIAKNKSQATSSPLYNSYKGIFRAVQSHGLR
jgi:hypothetical protein